MSPTRSLGSLLLLAGLGLAACGSADGSEEAAGASADQVRATVQATAVSVPATVELVTVTEAAPAAPVELTSLGEGEQVLESGLRILDQTVGDGAVAETGKTVAVHYTGTFLDGTKFDSSLDRGQPLEFTLGQSAIIDGLHQGIPGMKVGGKRLLGIPPSLAYKERGNPGLIPPNTPLLFTIELVDVK